MYVVGGMLATSSVRPLSLTADRLHAAAVRSIDSIRARKRDPRTGIPHSAEVIDLSEDDSEYKPAFIELATDVPPSGKSSPEVEIMEPPRKRCKFDLQEVCEDGIKITGFSGSTLAVNLVHARPSCPRNTFQRSIAKKSVRENLKFCSNCWCYVCDVPVPQCEQWASNSSKTPAHCNAHDQGKVWMTLRQHAKAGRRAFNCQL
mmetsp:Transcript_9299/g.19455  ORF Transcript_9299/g.19455 Transcript_9299/m.19455 type:complete len:203 (+) Transcript_9299:3-611(+)